MFKYLSHSFLSSLYKRTPSPNQSVFEEMEGYASLEKWGDPNFDGEEEETLSLCDLPVCANNGENQETIESKSLETEDFHFGSSGGSLLIESEMCAADELFFQGQILPLRLSVSSEPGIRQEGKNLSSRSESMERSSSDGLTSLSSRSNSTGSHNSTTTTTTSTYKPKFRNQFHSHPSPNPQIFSTSRQVNASYPSRKSTIWGIFRVGLVRTPEIELQELKLRNANNAKRVNSRSSSSSSSRKSDIVLKTGEVKKKTERFLFEGCRCSVESVERVVIIKKKKVVNARESKEEVKEKEKEEEKQRKQALHHRRTFEWLKELSIAHVTEEM